MKYSRLLPATAQVARRVIRSVRVPVAVGAIFTACVCTGFLVWSEPISGARAMWVFVVTTALTFGAQFLSDAQNATLIGLVGALLASVTVFVSLPAARADRPDSAPIPPPQIGTTAAPDATKPAGEAAPSGDPPRVEQASASPAPAPARAAESPRFVAFVAETRESSQPLPEPVRITDEQVLQIERAADEKLRLANMRARDLNFVRAGEALEEGWTAIGPHRGDARLLGAVDRLSRAAGRFRDACNARLEAGEITGPCPVFPER